MSALPSPASTFEHLRGQALQLRQQGQCAEAVALFCRAAIAAREQGNNDLALQCYIEALRADPQYLPALNGQGTLLWSLGQTSAAAQCFRNGLALAPANADLLNNLGLTHSERAEHGKAIECFRRAIAARSPFPEAHNNLGIVLRTLGRNEEALRQFDIAIAQQPDYAEAHNNRGATFEDLAQPARAAECYEAAIAIDHAHAHARYNRALLLLRHGQWQEGWAEFEWRFRTKWCIERTFAQPKWRGRHEREQTILLWTEQGLGDTLQFVRLAGMLKQRGLRVIVECQRPLQQLLESCPFIDSVVARGDELPAFDFHFPLLSLPAALDLQPRDLPGTIPYLSARADLVQLWRERLAQYRGRRIGIHWRGSATYRNDFHRSFPLLQAALLARLPGVHLFSLQKDAYGSARGELCRRLNIVDFGNDLDTDHGPFMDTAAIMANLDLVITCDTSIAHLAGAMGIATWLALRHVADWRWMTADDIAPWYPTVKLFRQPRPDDWHTVFQRIQLELAQHDRSASATVADPTTINALRALAQQSLDVARTYHRSGDSQTADLIYGELLGVLPDHAQALYGRGLIHQGQGRLDEAADHYRRALQADPLLASAQNNLGNVLLAQDRLDDAAVCYRRAIALRPEYAEAHNNLGVVHKRQNHIPMAERCFAEALRIAPNFAQAHFNLGTLYQDNSQFTRARECYERALELQPKHVQALVNLGNIYQDAGDVGRAAEYYDAALKIEPEHTHARYNQSLLQLRSGNWQPGWSGYELRFRTRPDVVTRPFNQPPWEGQSIAGQTVLLWAEQGLGDTLQFIRFAELIKRAGGRVVLECQPGLQALLQSCPYLDETVVRGERLPPFDYQLPLLSLPMVLNVRPEDVASDVPYLAARADLVKQWRERLGARNGLRVGLHWRGNPMVGKGYVRSFPLLLAAQLNNLPQVQLISLQQNTPEAHYGPTCERLSIGDYGDQLDVVHGAFMDTAAIMANLDLVITCDTSIAHLAGAMGIPTWLALAQVADWRWMTDEQRTIWYASVRLFRQLEPGSWRATFARIAEQLMQQFNIAGPAVEAIFDEQRQQQVAGEIFELGLQLHQSGNLCAANAAYVEVLAVQPEHAYALNARGLIRQHQGALGEASTLFRQALSHRDDLPDAHNNLGNVYLAEGHSEEATACFRRAIELRADYAEAHNNLGIACKQLGNVTAAETSYRAAIRHAPRFAQAHYNLGNLYQERLQLDQALECFDLAIAADQQFAAAHHNRALLLLMRGELIEGFRQYHWRWRTPLCPPHSLSLPTWHGEHPAGRCILLVCEQGLGDTIHFVRYAQLLKALGANVWLRVQRPLASIMRLCPYLDGVVAEGDALPGADWQVPLLELPRLLGTSLETIPADVPYLTADRRLVEHWGSKLSAVSNTQVRRPYRVGIHWQGSTHHPNDAARSIPRSLFVQLLDIPEVQLISLQKDTADRSPPATTPRWVDWTDEFDVQAGPFMDTAAVMMHLDLVIGCDSAIAHLAGALGKPVWLALPHFADWRWMLDRSDSPWYPTMRLFRQSRPGDWTAVFRNIRAALQVTVMHSTTQRAQEFPVPEQSSVSSKAQQLEEALGCHRAGQLDRAEQIYRRLRTVEPDNLDVLHMSGLLAYQQGRHQQAIELLERAATIGGEVAQIYNHLGLAYAGAERGEDALRCYRKAIDLQPEFAEPHTNLGSLYLHSGATAAAIACYQQARRLRPDDMAAIYNLALAWRAADDVVQAAECFRQCLALAPHHQQARKYLADCLVNVGQLPEAAEHLEYLLRDHPREPLYWNQLGNVRKQQGRSDVAQHCYQQAIAFQPDYVEAHYNLGLLMLESGDHQQAMAQYERALHYRPTFVPALKNLCHLQQLIGETQHAAQSYARALQLQPSPALQWADAMLLPIVYQSREDLHQWRNRLQERIDHMAAEQVRLNPVRDPINTTFFLAYQGRNDLDLHRKFAGLCNGAINTCEARCSGPRDGGRRIRVGFISKYFYDHTIGRLNKGLIAGLNRQQFTTVVLSLQQADDDTVRFLRERVDEFITLPTELVAARRMIAELKLDVLFYTDIGMSPASYALALSRLAPVQCVSWGHPVTSGLPSMDYFISSNLIESEDAQQHYSETLVRLDTINCYYYRPTLGTKVHRDQFGLTEHDHLYVCPQSIFKMHPDFDPVLAGILRQDPRGKLLLLEGNYPAWTQSLMARLRRSMPDVVDRVAMLPRSAHDTFLGMLALADVLLDPVHFGGGNSSYEALALGVPIVTMPSQFLRGRVTAGLYRKMGFDALVARDEQHYIELAVGLGTDVAFRAEVRQAIQLQADVLFEDQAAIRQLEEFLLAACERSGGNV